MSKKILKQFAITLIEDNLRKYFNASFATASNDQIFKALASVTMDELYQIRAAKKSVVTRSNTKQKSKTLHYLTIEFLPGKTLRNTLFNLGWESVFAQALKQKGIDINKIYAVEADAGIGNGGLGRLAACYMDSLATLNYPATTHCIKYDYGLFKQRIIDSCQVEFLDEWLKNGSVWLTPRPDDAVTVHFEGSVSSYKASDGRLKFVYDNAQEVEAIPYDMMLSGYHSRAISNLRLWSAKSSSTEDLRLSPGAVANKIRTAHEIESLNSVLYPNNDNILGKNLRLKQQYFLCSASIQSIIKIHVRKGYSLAELPNHVAIHINDTHPALSIPELMRVLMDDYGFGWNEAWDIVTKCVSYTNHTIMSEALEVWDTDSLNRICPRIFQIICEIDRRFRETIAHAKKLSANPEDMSIISHGHVRMAHLSIVASHKVNGVSKIHTDILKQRIFNKFVELTPEKFINITNGVTHRRWLAESNAPLTEFITTYIGDKFLTDANSLKELKKFCDDPIALKKINQIKLQNKKEFAKWLKEYQCIDINPESRYDVHVKRVHEYKRQLLNILRVIHLFNVLKANPRADIVPQTFIFAGKAASSYYMAKRIIKLINQVAAEIEKDERINKILKVVFVENFSVTISEKLLPAADVTEQTSLAGREASGTGNMKAVMNGAVMLCTLDGANAEIMDVCGKDGSFVFGLTPDEVEETYRTGYNPIDIYNSNPKIMGVIDALNYGFNGEGFGDVSAYLLGTANHNDNYMCLADFEDYLCAHDRMDALYRKPLEWAKVILKNIANMGYFSSDRAVLEYIDKIWHLTKLK